MPAATIVKSLLNNAPLISPISYLAQKWTLLVVTAGKDSQNIQPSTWYLFLPTKPSKQTNHVGPLDN